MATEVAAVSLCGIIYIELISIMAEFVSFYHIALLSKRGW